MRADVYIFEQGMAKSRQNAKILIESQSVIIDGKLVSKSSLDIDESTPHHIKITNKPKFISRGGEKLDFALDAFKFDPANLSCIDVGASTGGFTDCLLQRGAKIIYAVDSGCNQLDPTIAENTKVISIEKFNARYMTCDNFPINFDLAVMDVSFISQTLIYPGINSVLKPEGSLISLIKPQFECGKSALNSHGIVKKSSYHLQAINKIIYCANLNGFSSIDIVRSPIQGGNGNTEYLIHLIKSYNPTNLITEEKIKQLMQLK